MSSIDAELSSFIPPSIVDRDPVVVAIGTEGAAPVLGQGLRAEIEAMLPPALGALARAASALRERVAEPCPPAFAAASSGSGISSASIRDAFCPATSRPMPASSRPRLPMPPPRRAGRVSLVGAGPGDPELLTLKAQRKLQEADVIVYDRLVGSAHSRNGAPRCGPHSRRQDARATTPPKQERDQRHPDPRSQGRPPCRAPQGRRSLCLRPRRRGAGGARSRRHRRRCRARHHRGSRLRRLDRPAADPAWAERVLHSV